MTTEEQSTQQERTVYVDGRQVTAMGNRLFYYCDDTKPETPRADFVIAVVDGDRAIAGREGGEAAYELHRGRVGWMCTCKAGRRGVRCYHRRVVEGIEKMHWQSGPTPEERGRYLLNLLAEAIEAETGKALAR